jgi:hypothetical protein
MEPATKQDITELKQWMLDREVSSIRWFVATQITYFVITLGAIYFMLQHFKG